MTTELSSERVELYKKATRHLTRKDPKLGKVIRSVGHCKLAPTFEEPLTLLVRCVISQQISTKAAATILDRLMQALQGPPIVLRGLKAMTDEQLRACGLSGGKQRAIRAICERVETDSTFLKRLPELDDIAFRKEVTQIKGIGPWSADMLLMFGLGRLDVLPVGDLGFKMGVKKVYGYEELPTLAELEEVSQAWQPYRSIATWYCWRAHSPT